MDQGLTNRAPTIDARIREMDRDRLSRLWQRRWRQLPPKGLSRRLLECSAAWQLQVDEQGAVPAALRRRLDELVASSEAGPGKATGRSVRGPGRERGEPSGGVAALRPGMRLVRQWQGVSHVVEMTDRGFLYDGQVFGSLTAVARAITGVRWSGPRFFGLATRGSGSGERDVTLAGPEPLSGALDVDAATVASAGTRDDG